MSITLPPSFFAPPPGHDDPLLPAGARYADAVPNLGPGALVRRFGLGRRHAAQLLEVLRAQRVCMGLAWRGVYRVNPHAWAALWDGRS